MAVSLVLHVLALGAIVTVGVRQVFSPNVDAPASITFMAFAPPHPPVEITTDGATPAPPTPLELPSNLDTLFVPAPAPPPAEVTAPEPPAPEPPPAPAVPPPPPKPAVTVGSFASSASAAPTAAPRATVQTAGFDAAAAIAPDLGLKQAAVGAFDAAPTAAPRVGTDRPGVVAAGFEASKGTAPAVARTGQVAATGFGAAAPAQAPQARRDVVQAGGFGDARATAPAPGQPQIARAAPIGTPVEVLSKPTPAYTDEARAGKVEGDVVLDVEFTASGQVRVLRVVRGLGHGLDEMASRAAEKIRFKPATDAGRPVDVRASVTIVFRLS